MKKMVVISALLIFVAGSASAESLKFADGDAGKTVGAVSPANMPIGKTSKGVKIQITYDDGTTGGTAYAMQTVHLNGSKIFGTAFDSTAIMVQTPEGIAKDIFDANELPSSTATGDDPCFDSTWTSL